VVLVYFLTLRMSIFEWWTINWWLYKQNITWLRRSVRKRKAETMQSDIVRYYHRSKLCCMGINEFVSALFVQVLHYFGFTIQLVIFFDFDYVFLT